MTAGEDRKEQPARRMAFQQNRQPSKPLLACVFVGNCFFRNCLVFWKKSWEKWRM